jgi:hypothetical protein
VYLKRKGVFVLRPLISSVSILDTKCRTVDAS